MMLIIRAALRFMTHKLVAQPLNAPFHQINDGMAAFAINIALNMRTLQLLHVHTHVSMLFV